MRDSNDYAHEQLTLKIVKKDSVGNSPEASRNHSLGEVVVKRFKPADRF